MVQNRLISFICVLFLGLGLSSQSYGGDGSAIAKNPKKEPKPEEKKEEGRKLELPFDILFGK